MEDKRLSLGTLGSDQPLLVSLAASMLFPTALITRQESAMTGRRINGLSDSVESQKNDQNHHAPWAC